MTASVLEAHPLCEDFPQLLYQITLNGIKPPHHKVVLSYMPSITNNSIVYAKQIMQPCHYAILIYTDHSSDASVQQPQASPGVLSPVHVHPQPLAFSTDMNYKQLAVWLTNHPQFVRADCQEDINKLNGIL